MFTRTLISYSCCGYYWPDFILQRPVEGIILLNFIAWDYLTMSIDKIIFAFAGVVILSSVALSQLHSIYWLWVAAFVGANMLQAAFTGFCPLAMILKTAGAKPGQAFS